MPSPSEAPSGGAKTFWLLLGRLPKVTRCKSGTTSRRDHSNGYAPNPPPPIPPDSPAVGAHPAFHSYNARLNRDKPD